MEELTTNEAALSQTVQVISATNSYDDDFDLLDTSAAKELIKQGMAPGLDIRQEGGGGISFDDTYKYHRNIGIWDDEYITWEWKLEPYASKKKELKPNLIDAHKFHAVRGVIVDLGWGAGVSNGESKDKFIRGCQTVRAEVATKDMEGRSKVFTIGGPEKEISHPSPIPFSRTWSTADPTKKTFGKMSLDFPPNLNLYAKKIMPSEITPDGKDVYAKDGDDKFKYEEVSCRECVANNKFNMYLDGAKSKPYTCKAQAHLVFVVFELGRQNIEQHFESPEDHPIGIDWIPVSEAGLNDCNGNPITQPFALYFKNVAALYKDFGKERHELNIKFPSDYNPGDELEYWLPTDRQPMTLKDLYKWLIDPAGLGTRHNFTKSGNQVFTSLVDIYVGRMGDRNNYRPVFYPVPLDNNDCFKGINVNEYWKAAKAIQKEEKEFAEVTMKKTFEESKTLNGSTDETKRLTSKTTLNGSTSSNSKSTPNGSVTSNGTSNGKSKDSVQSSLGSLNANSFRFNEEEDD